EDVERIGGAARLPAGAAWKAGAGCKACGDSGFRGRLAVHELMYVTEELRELISRRASEDELREAAKRAGMRTLMEDGIAKAAQGATTLDELARVVPPDSSRVIVATVPAPRADPRTARAAILMLTSDTSPEREEEGLAVGADDYMSKPVEPRRLAARVRSLAKRAERRTSPA